MVQLADSATRALNWSQDVKHGDQKARDSLAVRIGAISGLKTFPIIAQKVISLLSKSDFTIDDITDTIRQDPALAAGVLRLANSPFYISTHLITSLDIAFIRLGRNTVRQAIFAVATMQMFPDTQGIGRLIRDHCAAVAAISHCLSRRFLIGSPEVMFLSGLMHDIGTMLLIDSGEVNYELEKNDAYTDSECMRNTELKQVHFDHAVVGAQVLSRWKVGSPIPQIVAYHHLPELAWETPEIGSLVALLRLADRIELYQSGQPSDLSIFFQELINSEEGIRLHLTEDRLRELWDELRTARQEALSLFP